ncbi:esterase ybfF [Elysia marginata]|uniref:Esterase ybfF n=1 Tax=Elysia marginata TaxID=1093978 RepID=A0AAV4JEA4_9GAST|nr:esterase ybfF [Elysia marginata]
MILNFLLTNLKTTENGQVVWRVNVDPFIENYSLIADFPVPDGSTFNKPTLFVFGKNSEHYESGGLERIKVFFPQAEIVAINDAGHFVHADKPLEFVEVVQDFCDEVDAS